MKKKSYLCKLFINHNLCSMAKLDDELFKARGSVGSVTFRKTQNGTVMSEKCSSRRDRRTRANMQQRTQWGNIQAMYRLMREHLAHTFEDCGSLRKANNMYMHLNVGRCPVYLPKSMTGTSACVVAPHQISYGLLKPVLHSLTANKMLSTNIHVGRNITGQTSVADFSHLVITLNEDFRNGDSITLYVLRQHPAANGLFPEASCSAYEIRLDTSDNSTISRLPGWNEWWKFRDGCLVLKPALSSMAVAFVHTRVDARGNVKASSQTLVCENPLLAQYSSEEAFLAAAQSYGGFTSERRFLAPNDPSGKKSYPVLIQSSDEALGSVLPHSGRFLAGDMLQLSATPAEGAAFECWTDLDDNIVSEEPVCQVSVSSGAAYIAHFCGENNE